MTILAKGCATSISTQNATQKFVGHRYGHSMNTSMISNCPDMMVPTRGPIKVMDMDIMVTQKIMLNTILVLNPSVGSVNA